MAKANDPQDIDTLKKRHRDLDKQKTTAEADLKSAEKQLKQLKADALEKYGTDDLEALKGKLEQMKTDNLKKRREYQQHLDAILREAQQIVSNVLTARDRRLA